MNCNGCGKEFDQRMLMVQQDGGRRCGACLVVDLGDGEQAAPSGAWISVSLGFVRGLLAQAQTQARAAAPKSSAGGRRGPRKVFDGSKTCRRCDKAIDQDKPYVFCWDCSQLRPECGDCGDGKVGWNSDNEDWYARCWTCAQAA